MLPISSLRPTTSIRPLTTAHLAQTMALLELTAAELDQKVQAALANNPALELREERRCPSCRQPLPQTGPCPRCTAPKTLSPDEPIVFVSPRQDFYVPSRRGADDLPSDNYSPVIEDLPTYVLKQIAPELQEEDRRLAAFILTNLNEDGLLEVTPVEVARYHHLPASRIESVLQLIQRADPIGVGSTSPQEALLVQLEVLEEMSATPPQAAQAIREGLDLLSRRQYGELARLLGVTAREAREIARFISDNLNPFPGRAFWGDVRNGNGSTPPTFTNPDVLITYLNEDPENPLVVEVVSPYAGLLQVNPLFRQAICDAPKDKSEQWQADLESADLLVKCIQQRTNTIVRLMRLLTIRQREFILHGDSELQPTTRASLAEELGVHESTISRAVANKAVQLPNGHIVPLAKFFDRSLHIRTAVKEIIDQETKPLSDSQIVKQLKKQGHKVARRTVAKYRSMEGILPSHLRQSAAA